MARAKPPIDAPAYEEPTADADGPTGDADKPTEVNEPDAVGAIAVVDPADAGQVSTRGAVNLDSPVKLTLAKNITDAQFDQIGTQIGVMGSAYKFWLGDLIIAGAKRWNKSIVHVCEYFVARITPQYDVHTLQNIASVMATITPDVRVDGISFGHHDVVSRWPATPKERKKMLLKARDEMWSVRVLTQKLNERVTGKPSAGNNVHVDDVGGDGKPDSTPKSDKGKSAPAGSPDTRPTPDGTGDEPAPDGTGPTHPSRITLSFEASQAATYATEDYNTAHHKNLTVDRFVSNILENLPNVVILSDDGMAALLTLKNASVTGQAMDIGQAASSVFINSVKRRTAAPPASGPPPVEQPAAE